MKSKRDIDIMRVEKDRKKLVEKIKMLKSLEIVRERERERELQFKPTFGINLALFVILKLYIKYRNFKDGLYLKKV